MRQRAEYVLPLRWLDDRGLPDLTGYLRRLAGWLDVTVVDGSPAPVFAEHEREWGDLVRHLRPRPRRGANGKVAGVMTGLQTARHEHVVIADDDVRYDRENLTAVLARLDGADLVHPQNVFSDWPWHARWDTARSLVNRATGPDYSGTTAVRRSVVLAAGGYDGDVLFENLELIRTVTAAGGRVDHAADVFVARRPPAVRHFVSQRVRQAYDDFAEPGRLLRELAIAPLVVALLVRRRPDLLVVAAGVAVAVAVVGRLRHGGRQAYPPDTPLWAPLWLAERGVCSWLALGYRFRGGVPYAGGRLVDAATPLRILQRRAAARRPVGPDTARAATSPVTTPTTARRPA